MKAIITDLGRTLLRTDKTVSEYTRTILKKCRDRGIVLMAATARSRNGMQWYLTDFRHYLRKVSYIRYCLAVKKAIYGRKSKGL